MDRGGQIHIDGTGTKQRPYECNTEMAHEQQMGIVVQKSLNMEGLRSMPHILCFNGFHFIKSTTQALFLVLFSAKHH